MPSKAEWERRMDANPRPVESAQSSSHCSCGADIASDLRTKRELAEGLVERIDQCLPKWRAWFPDEQSTVEVPRDELLAMKAFAEIALREK